MRDFRMFENASVIFGLVLIKFPPKKELNSNVCDGRSVVVCLSTYSTVNDFSISLFLSLSLWNSRKCPLTNILLQKYNCTRNSYARRQNVAIVTYCSNKYSEAREKSAGKFFEWIKLVQEFKTPTYCHIVKDVRFKLYHIYLYTGIVSMFNYWATY